MKKIKSAKKKTKPNRTTKENLWRPSNPKKYNTPYTFNRSISQFIDKIDTGRNKGKRKSHALINKYLSLKNSQSTHNITLRVKRPPVGAYLSTAPHVQYINSIEEHLDGTYFLYYQNKPDSFIHLINLDIDSIDNPTEDLYEDIAGTVSLLKAYLSDCYYDMGSSSRSLNYFILVDSEALYDLFIFIDTHLSFPRFICKVLNSISTLFRCAFNHPSPVRLPHNLKFDGIKATIADYEYTIFNDRTYYNKIINSGTFAKLPRPTSTSQFEAFYNMPIIDIINLIYLSIYFFNITLLSSALNNEEVNKARESYNFLSELVESPFLAQDALPSQEEAPGCAEKSISTPSSNTPSSIYTIMLPGILGLRAKNEGMKLGDEYSKDAMIRGLSIGQRMFREYWIEEGRIPTKEEYRKYYRKHPASTGAEDQGDIERLNRIYEFIDNGFIPEKVGEGKNIISKNSIEEDELLIEKLITQEEVNQIKNSHGKTYKKRKISHRDLAVGMAYFFDKSMRRKINKELEGRELTVSTEAMANFTYELYEKGILKKREAWKDEKKCRAIRYVLEHINWIECLDADWDRGISKRWSIGSNYHRYDEFEKYIGKSTINRIRAKGLKSLQDWENMGDVG